MATIPINNTPADSIRDYAEFSCRLENTNPGHDKYYELWIWKNEINFIVYSIYGKIGTNGTVQNKGVFALKQHDSAVICCEAIREAKLKKGYKLVIVSPSLSSTKKNPILSMSAKPFLKSSSKQKPIKHSMFSRRLSIIDICPPEDS